ncbi:MAG TPA: M36 family metallopeptidase, partial [Baekduia sp.]|nr:M36 family metallopeptidase [Baekduia sp.]
AATGGTQESVDLSAWISPTPSCTSSLTLCLSGPNAHVYADRSAPTGITGGTDGDTGPSSGTDFVYPIVGKSPYSSSYACPNVTVPSAPASCTWDGHTASSATSNLNEVTTQVFYYVNAFHDWLKTSAIQFSDHNFEGADPVLAETDDYGGLDNANMWTPPDGASPTMQMYLFDSPAANGGDDATIVYHEYTHGLTNRLVGGDGQANGLDAKQSEAMGEGWSDWYALDFLTADGKITDTSAPGDEVIGAYVTNNTNTGIRYNAIDCPVGATADQHCPGTSSAGSGGFTFADLGLVADYQGTDRPVFEVHADGEIWSETLWDLRTAIGGSAARKLITSALRLSPKAPSFLDMRNAILQADTAAHAAGDPSHHDVIWSVFAQRGMGFSASTSSANATHATAAFDLPPAAAAGAADVTALALEQTTPIHIPIVNIGGTALTGVHATLTAAGGVTVATATADVGSIAAGGSALGTFAVRVPASFGCGTIASFTLTITSSGGTSTVPFAIPVGSGRATAATATLSGAAATIPDDRADTGLTSSLAIGTPGRVGTLRVTLTATHTAVGDLHAWLISPAGTRIDLMENPGGSVGSLANVAAATPLVFDDAATTAIQDVSPSATATGGAFRPNEPLATLAKQSRVGTWTLHVTDTYALDSGTLSSWSLETDEPACAITDAPTGLSADAATLHARLDPGTSATSAVFQIGTTTAYTGESGAMALTASGGLQSVAFSTAGLAAGTTYHVRAVALRNGTLVAAGADQTFVAGSQPATTGPSSSSDATSTTTTATILPTVATARISGLARAVRLDRRGRFTLSFTATPAQAQGTLRVTGGTASAAAAKSFTVPSSGTVKLVVKASTKARAALRRHTALTTKLVFRIGATTITRTLTVKPYKKSR